VLLGKPTILAWGHGTIEIGDRFQLASSPVTSHLVSWGTLRIGDDVSIGHGCAIAAARSVTIGDRIRIGPFFVVMDTDFHGERAKVGARPTTNTVPGEESGFAPVRIGGDVSIGANVTVLRGTTVGDGATIAPGSVVSGNVPSGAFVAGVPARSAHDQRRQRVETESDPSVIDILTRLFNLPERPSRLSGPAEITQWDSLGTLKLMLALEEVFHITLDEHAVSKATSVAELETLVEFARSNNAVSSIHE
jgi:acetyltransferase-like isoleucine patch superfamily enzyme/acyl carrier protein